MNNVSKNAAEMAVQCVEFLEDAGYDKHSLWGNVYSHFMTVVRYLKKHGHTEYIPELADTFVSESHERYINGEISRSTYKDYQRAVRRMNEFYEGGIITHNVEQRVSRYQLCDEYERLRSGFLASRIFHPNTRHDFSWAVRRYLCYFQDHGIYSLSEATVEDARNFVVEAASTMSSGSLHNVLCYLKQFHVYLSGINEPAPDCAALFSVPVQREIHIRGYVSDEELERILAQTDLSPRHSKRDKAIIMLGATTGLRAVDIVRLKMSDIDWANGEIRIIQQKTGTPIILPLMKPAGEALKDYILNERKSSDAEEVFIRALAPYVALTDSQSVEYLFDQYCIKAGIERTPFDGKGFHGLRRRLGKNLLVSGSPVAVVSQVLGHQDAETSKTLSFVRQRELKGMCSGLFRNPCGKEGAVMADFKSGLSQKMQAFLDYEKAAGYSESTYLSRLRNLDTFLVDNYPEETGLSENIVMEWAVRREKESPATFNNRCGFIRKFGTYLTSTGDHAYILPNKFCSSVSSFSPYIFSDDELKGLFRSIDHLTDPDPFVPFVLSTAFRLIYTCGLRPNESRNLKRGSINLKTGEILITETKHHKDRVVVMSQDMLELAGAYSFIRDAAYPDSDYFFPAPDGRPYPSSWYQKHLKKAFREIHPDISKDELPQVRVYDLRHRFASAVLMRWIDSGRDLYSRLPYLQSYMGHNRLSSTAYYIHLLPENLVRSAGIDWNVLETIIPEVELWEE